MPPRRLPVAPPRGSYIAPPRGFTLIELIVVMLIAGIVIAFAMPDMRRMINENRVANEANSMLSVLTFARNEAVKRNTPVGVCVSTDGSTCATPGASGYAAGVIVYVNASGSVAGARSATLDVPLLQAVVPLANGTAILGDANLAQGLVFNPGGDLPLGQQDFFAVVPLTGAPANSCQRLIELLPIGRARVVPARYVSGSLTSAASYSLTQDCGVAG